MASDEQQENTATGLPFTRGKRKGFQILFLLD